MPLQTMDAPVSDQGHFLSFTMATAGRTVSCHVQVGALDSVERSRAGDASDRVSRFHRHRAAFEAVASDLFDAGLPLRITADHMTWLRKFVSSRQRAAA